MRLVSAAFLLIALVSVASAQTTAPLGPGSGGGPGGGGGGASPAGATGTVQYNAGGGLFGGITNWKTSGTNDLTGSGGSTLAVNGCTIGSYAMCTAGTSNLIGAVTLGTQQTTQGSLVLANTAAGSFSTTIQSSNSATGAYTITLPVAAPVGNGYALTATTGGVASWSNIGAGPFLPLSGGTLTGTLSVGGAAQGSNALAVTGTSALSSTLNLTSTGGTAGTPTVYLAQGTDTGLGIYRSQANVISVAINSTRMFDFGTGQGGAAQVSLPTNGILGWANLGVSNQAFITSPGSNSIQHGNADAAVAVAQTLRVQSVVAGTAAANGANWTLIGSLGTGTGTPGSMTFQVGVAQASGTAQSTATTALQIVGAANGSLPTVLMPGLANTATTSAVCYNTSTGLLTYDGTVGTCNTSTMRVKHDIKPLSDAALLNGVLKMRPVSFEYNESQHTPGTQFGLIAEDLANIDPHLVAYDGEGKPIAIQYLGPMFSYLIGAVKRQQAEIDALRKQEVH